MNRKSVKITSTILSFILSITLFISALGVSLYLSVFDSDRLYRSLTSPKYIEDAHEDFMFKMAAIATPAYVKEESYKDVFSKEQFSEDVGTYFRETFKTGERYDMSKAVDPLKIQLSNNLIEYGKSLGEEVDTEMRAQISEFSNAAIETYTSYVCVNYIQYYPQIINRFSTPVLVATAVSVVISAFVIYLLLRLGKDLEERYKFLSIAFSTSALFTGAYPVYSAVTGLYKNFNIRPDYLYEVITDFLLNVQNVFFIFAGILLFVGVVFAVATERIRRKRKK